ncbi:uncharacterized protein LOC141654843 [Silene latifolia]|uniref:uncharacterized protein LOC141654843 n=1 Tax=Silene latifolia TaxID=37657 RepID=UPI003D777D38
MKNKYRFKYETEVDLEIEVPPTTIDLTFKTSGLFGVDNLVVRLENESDGDSEELRSLEDSDGEIEIDQNLIFNPEVDFKRKLKKLSAYCVNKCDCEWDSVRSKVKACTCNNPDKCLFRVCAAITHLENVIQIKGMKLEHSCAFSTYTRIRPSWKLKEFKAQVYKDLLVEVSYRKLWKVTARAKLLIHVHKPIPIFQRKYMCLEACMQGFVRCCRPIIGVDMCHLKGPYPRICLVAVGKDGNNNIFPIAWAVVEVENPQTWRWFLVLLLNDVARSNEEGKVLTFMSDK